MNTIKGDLLKFAKEGKFDMIVHGSNCFCTMNSGVAKQIRHNFPQAYEADLKTIKGDQNKLGTFTVAKISSVDFDWETMDMQYYVDMKTSVFYVINAYTQYKYGTDKQHFDYQAFKTFLYSFKNYVELMYQSNIRKNETGRFNDEKVKLEIGFPMIGSGLAGGDWERIEKMLEEFSETVSDVANVTIVEYVP